MPRSKSSVIDKSLILQRNAIETEYRLASSRPVRSQNATTWKMRSQNGFSSILAIREELHTRIRVRRVRTLFEECVERPIRELHTERATRRASRPFSSSSGQEGFEPPTYGFVVRCSIQLSHCPTGQVQRSKAALLLARGFRRCQESNARCREEARRMAAIEAPVLLTFHVRRIGCGRTSGSFDFG